MSQAYGDACWNWYLLDRLPIVQDNFQQTWLSRWWQDDALGDVLLDAALGLDVAC